MADDLLERLIREAEKEGTPPQTSATDGTAFASSDEPTAAASISPTVPMGASPLAGLLSNPAILSALPTLLSGMSGKGGEGVKKKPDRHTALLCAIKPYLGRERQQTADQLISLCRLWDTLQSSGLTRMLPTLLGGNAADGVVSAGMEVDHASPKEG